MIVLGLPLTWPEVNQARIIMHGSHETAAKAHPAEPGRWRRAGGRARLSQHRRPPVGCPGRHCRRCRATATLGRRSQAPWHCRGSLSAPADPLPACTPHTHCQTLSAAKKVAFFPSGTPQICCNIDPSTPIPQQALLQRTQDYKPPDSACCEGQHVANYPWQGVGCPVHVW